MVKSIVIPHDPSRSPRLRHLATASDFQPAVDGWLEPIEMPALNVTVYVNEAARREQQPINCRAMSIWWLHTANPMSPPIILGDVVMVGIAEDGGSTDVPDALVHDIFESREFVVQIRPPQDTVWHDTFARFADVFDAATWCMVLTYTLHPGTSIRLRSRAAVVESETFDDSFRGSDAPYRPPYTLGCPYETGERSELTPWVAARISNRMLPVCPLSWMASASSPVVNSMGTESSASHGLDPARRLIDTTRNLPRRRRSTSDATSSSASRGRITASTELRCAARSGPLPAVDQRSGYVMRAAARTSPAF